MVASLTHTLASFVIPSSERNDPEPVRSSLAQARADFERGEVREALKHLRRAAEGADDAGSDMRAVALARAAADLATEVGASLTPAPAAAAPVSSAPSTAPAASAVMPIAAAASVPAAAQVSAAPPSVVRGNADAALKQLLDSGRAVKVVVKRSARDEGLYVVRRADSHSPALGTREAVVVLLDNDDGFFAPLPSASPPAAAPSQSTSASTPSVAPPASTSPKD
jgi:hypothetical protein